jgi:hypothetical protein
MTELTLTPAARRRLVRANLTFAAVLVPLFAVNALNLWSSARHGGLALMNLVFALAILPLTYYFARRMGERSLITFGDGSVTVRGWGRPRRFSSVDVERVVTIDQMRIMGSTPTHHLIVVGPHRRLALLAGRMWDREQLSRLALDLESRGVPLVPVRQPVTPRQLRKLDPRLVPWHQAHPVGLALVLFLAILLALVAAFVIMAAIQTASSAPFPS